MSKKVTIFTLILGMFLLANVLFAQGPIPIVTPTFIDSAVYNGVYRGVQNQFFCEPTTGNLIAAWYRYYSGQPDPRRITAAVSTDGGASWIIHEDINLGVGAEMNARYPSVWGTPTTPIIAYGDRNPGGSNREARPTVAYDVVGWGGGVFDNIFVDDSGSPDTVLYGRYVSVRVAPDNDNFWAVGCYHNADPGEALYYYYSQDGGLHWSRPRVPASAAKADSGVSANYVIDLSSSSLGVCPGYNNEVMVSGLGQWYHDDDLWRILYAFSSDMGNTWSPISIIPGADNLTFSNSDFYRQFTEPILDKSGNYHIFAVGVDTMESGWANFPQPYRSWDFRYDGATWTINKFVFPKMLDNGIVAWGDWPADIEQYPMNEPAVGPDGTLYYTYSDVVDTTGAGGDEHYFNYNMMVMFSEDNGDTWKGPVSVLDQWNGRYPNGVARNATDKLHIVYRRHFETAQADEFYYMGVPTDTIKARATKVDQKITKIMPTEFKLHQNYPNPFNPTTNITFDLKERTKVVLKIYNEIGQEVATLIDKIMDAGFKGITWYATDLPSGVYFCKLMTGNYSETKRMILAK